MLKKLHILLLTVLAALCCTAIAWADYDYIDRYDVDVLPNTDDGSLTITVSLTWTALEELPYGQELKVGIPNGSIREKTALTDNIERLSFDNRYMYIYLDRAYKKNETFTFSYRWVQEYMYGLDGGAVAQHALAHGVVLAPGEAFSASRGWRDHLRFNAAQSGDRRIYEVLEAAISQVRAAR